MTDFACPDIDRLLRFLETPSPGVDDEAIAVHIEGCASAGPSWSGWPRRRSPPNSKPSRPFARRGGTWRSSVT